MKKKAAIICCVALVAVFVVMALLALFLPREKSKLRSAAVSILEECRAGREERVYRTFSGDFRAALSLADFHAFLRYRRATLGRFVEAGEVKRALAREINRKDVREIRMPLRYEKAETEGAFYFVRGRSSWKLLSLTIPVPDELAVAAVEPFALEVLRLYDEKKLREIRGKFSPQLKEKCPLREFLPSLGKLRERHGVIRRATLQEGKEEGWGIVSMEFRLGFDSGESGRALFRCYRAREDWVILVFLLTADEEPPKK
jgi:hypothetical protein